MSNCKPLIFYGICCTLVMLLSVLGAFTKGVLNGVFSLIGAILYMAILLYLVNYYCKQSNTAGWIAGSLCILCGMISSIVITYTMYKFSDSEYYE